MQVYTLTLMDAVAVEAIAHTFNDTPRGTQLRIRTPEGKIKIFYVSRGDVEVSP